MIRITAFLGSPRRNGNTGQLVDKLTKIIHFANRYRFTGIYHPFRL